jgi:hypothetical protein
MDIFNRSGRRTTALNTVFGTVDHDAGLPRRNYRICGIRRVSSLSHSQGLGLPFYQ